MRSLSQVPLCDSILCVEACEEIMIVLHSSSSLSIFITEGLRPPNNTSVVFNSSCLLLLSCTPPESCHSSLLYRLRRLPLPHTPSTWPSKMYVQMFCAQMKWSCARSTVVSALHGGYLVWPTVQDTKPLYALCETAETGRKWQEKVKLWGVSGKTLHCMWPVSVLLLQSEYRKRGFTEVVSPNLYNVKLWQTSGHWLHYAVCFMPLHHMQLIVSP